MFLRSQYPSISLWMIAFCGLLWGLPAVAQADLAGANKLSASAMQQFHKKQYMAAVRLLGQSMGALPIDGAHKERSHSLFYIGLCYHRLKYREHAVGAWKRFLAEIKNIPNARADPDWREKLRLVKAVMEQTSKPATKPPQRRPPPDPLEQPDVGSWSRDRPPPRRRIAMVQPPSGTPPWLTRVRICLRQRTATPEAALRRLQYCHDRMPRGRQCGPRCSRVKGRIATKIKQLEQRLAPGNEPRDGGDEPTNPPPGDPQDGGYQGGRPDYGGVGARRPPKRRKGSLTVVGTVISSIGVGTGLLGLGLWLFANKLESDRDSLMAKTPSASNTTAIINKHNEAAGMQIAALVSFSAAAAGIGLGSLLISIGRRTDQLNYARVSPPPHKHTRKAKTYLLLSTEPPSSARP